MTGRRKDELRALLKFASDVEWKDVQKDVRRMCCGSGAITFAQFVNAVECAQKPFHSKNGGLSRSFSTQLKQSGHETTTTGLVQRSHYYISNADKLPEGKSNTFTEKIAQLLNGTSSFSPKHLIGCIFRSLCL